jgi:hypothetical protein
MLAINRGIIKRGALFAELNLKNGSFQRIMERLKKLGYIERPGRSIYALTTKGKSFITIELEPNPDVAFGTKSFQDYLEQFPEVFQAVLRLTLCSIVSKRTRIFDKFKSGYPGIILAGDPKIGKTPLGEIVCELLGLDPVAHKLDTQLVTTGEIKGRSRGRAGFDPSPWFTKVISILDEIDKILSASTSEVAKFLAHSDKYYIREEKPYLHRAVPFLTMNVQADTRGVIAKIREILGVEYIKRNAVVNVNPIKPYLGSPYLFFRKVCKNYPRISYRVPILRDEITDQEAELIDGVMDRAIKPGNEAYYDERGIEIQSLAHYSLSGGENMKSSIYSVCKDRLLCLETLETVEPGWRESFYNEWREHEAGRSPEAETRIRKAQIERAKIEDELKAKEDKIQDEKDKDLDDVQVFNEKYSRFLTIWEQWISQLRKVGKATEALALQKERTEYRKGAWTQERCEQMSRRMQRIRDNIMLPIQRELQGKRQTAEELKRRRDQERQAHREGRATTIEEMKNLISDLVQTELWTSEQSKIRGDTATISARQSGKILMGATVSSRAKKVITAIQNLRARSEKLRRSLRGFIDHRGNYSLPELERRIKSARREARPWLEEFLNDRKDYTDKALSWLLGGDKKRPEKSEPDEPRDDFDFGGGLDIGKTLER